MNSNNKIWGTLLKVALGLILVLSFLQVKMKFGWNPIKELTQSDSCDVNPPSILIDSIQVEGRMDMFVNDTLRLKPHIFPITASNKRLIWKSDDSTVADVDSTGLVTATDKGGKCMITAAATDGSNKMDTFVVVVTPKRLDNPDTVLVASIDLKKSSSNRHLKVGESYKVEVVILPQNASNKSLKWESSNLNIARVEDNGTITGVGQGNCTITASTSDGSNVSTFIKVYVHNPEIKVTSIILDKSTIDMKKGESRQIKATVLPVDASIKTLKWMSNDNSVATVNNGRIMGVGTGNCTVTASSTDGSNVFAHLKLHVSPILISSISLKDIEIVVDQSSPLKATIVPANATNKELEWTSSDSSVVTVNSNGVVTGKKEGGKAIITAKAKDGSGLKSACTVKVNTRIIVRDLDLGYATYTGKRYNGKPGKDGILTLKKDCTITSQNGYIKFSKGDKIRIESYNVKSDNTVVILGDLVTPGKEKANLYLYIYPD